MHPLHLSIDEIEALPGSSAPADSYHRQDSEVRTDEGEEGEAMDATNDDDAAMMAMMGLPASGFGSTKVNAILLLWILLPHGFVQGRHVIGNQEGAVDVKKMRTWRQYMNRCVAGYCGGIPLRMLICCVACARRGGFNRYVSTVSSLYAL